MYTKVAWNPIQFISLLTDCLSSYSIVLYFNLVQFLNLNTWGFFRFTWDTPLHEMLEDWFELYDSTLTDQTTLRDILSHRTGIPGYFVSLLAGLSSNATRAQIVRLVTFNLYNAEIFLYKTWTPKGF